MILLYQVVVVVIVGTFLVVCPAYFGGRTRERVQAKSRMLRAHSAAHQSVHHLRDFYSSHNVNLNGIPSPPKHHHSNRGQVPVKELGFRSPKEFTQRPGQKRVAKNHRRRRTWAAHQRLESQEDVRRYARNHSEQSVSKFASDELQIGQRQELPQNDRGEETRESTKLYVPSEGPLLAQRRERGENETDIRYLGDQVLERNQAEKHLGIHVEVGLEPLQRGHPLTAGSQGIHEERQHLESTQPAPISGSGAVLDVDEGAHAAMPLSKQADATFVGAGTVWTKLQEATLLRQYCAKPPCGKGKHIHSAWTDLADEMSRVQGAVVVRRSDLAKTSGAVAPASSLDFVKTLQSYFGIFQRTLFPTRTFLDGHRLDQVHNIQRFLDAVANGDSAAGRYLSAYYMEREMSKKAIEGYENTPVLVGMADVFINELGYVWNKKDMVVPKSCKTEVFGPRTIMAAPTGVKTYQKVFVIAQHWGDGYFHFLVEDLPRMTLMLDILREHPDIKVIVHAPAEAKKGRKEYMCQFLELLGVPRDRVIFLKNKGIIQADFAILPTSTPCGKPDTQMIGLLRHALLLALYPDTSGAPLPLVRPIILLVVRQSGRGLANSRNVWKALQEYFPSYDVVEFLGTGPVASQLKLFATASLIVAPHGAGLSNIMVSPLHTPVLEIGPPECSSCYIHLALKLQHVYARHPGSKSWKKSCESKYEPNVDEIILLVRHLLEGKRQADAADPPAIAHLKS